MIYSFKGAQPVVGKGAFIAPNATVIGDVEIGEQSSVWFSTVLRGDVGPIRVGAHTNIQDMCVVHQDWGGSTKIGDEVTIGHRTVIHGCTIDNKVLVGMGAVIMEGAVIGEGSLIAGGAVITPKTNIPPNSLVVGVPGKVVRSVNDNEMAMIVESAQHYVEDAAAYLEMRSMGGREQ